jgi:septum formation protein
VLASASPRRRELVPLLGLDWRVAPQQVVEADYLVGDPILAAVRIATAKARSALSTLTPDEVVLAADTLVVADGVALGKPTDADDAFAMLRRLRARTHTVASGVSLARSRGPEWAAVVTTRVTMRAYTNSEVEAYMARGEPFDKAGGYAVQDALFRPVAAVDGCFLNVVGLPLCAASRGLETLGVAGSAGGAGTLLPPCSFCDRGRAVVRIDG